MKNLLTASILLTSAACATAPTSGPIASLDATPRHHEWVTISGGDRPLHAYVVWPQRSDPAPAVLVIHENRGLTDWVRTVADRLAAEGYLAIAPDLLSGRAPGGGRTKDFPTEDAAREAIYALDGAAVLRDLENVAEWIRNRPGARGELYVGGFCWGGAQTFRFANAYPRISGAFVFYGTGPDEPTEVASIATPVYGFYGGNDERVNATIPRTAELMRAAGKRFEPVIYPGAGHAFMRLGEQPDASEANRRAREQAWQRWLTILED